MNLIKRIFSYGILFLAVNQIILFSLPINLPLKLVLGLGLAAFFIFYNVKPPTSKQPTKELKKLARSYELLLVTGFLFLMQTILNAYLLLLSTKIVLILLIANAILSFLLAYLVAVNGLVRSFAVSKQFTITYRVLFFFVWGIPILNLVFIIIAIRNTDSELKFNQKKYTLNLDRKEEEVCKTKYPIVMVHGIFFRDWELLNYWGRIPKELITNGAAIFYGGHQSSLSVEDSAEELKTRILSLIEEEGCEKVNVIAHSKGGIDTRYAISNLGLAPYIASLTTINTPHYGSDLAGKLLQMTPKKVVTRLGKSYSSLFTRLGDMKCDFVGSVNELTPERCKAFNKELIDSNEVFYQSAGSLMKSRKSAPFPLSLGYSIIGGDNDGLVATNSMKWGNFLGIVTGSGKKGISHGDMIDLSRKNIPGFDVTEFYVEIVHNLKLKGY